jgi:hypothetical protein
MSSTEVAHKFLPDFIVRLKNGVNLLLEVKGLHGEKEEAKFQAAKRWVAAVNNWGRMGRWDFHRLQRPDVAQNRDRVSVQATHPLKHRGIQEQRLTQDRRNHPRFADAMDANS